MSSIQSATLSGIQFSGSSSNYTGMWVMDDVPARYYHQPYFVYNRSNGHFYSVSENIGASKAVRLGGEEGTTEEASLSTEGAPISHCCAQFARLWGTTTVSYHVHSLHCQASCSSLQPDKNYSFSSHPAHETPDILSEELETRIYRDMEELLGEDTTTDTENIEILTASKMFPYGSDPVEQELKKKWEEHAKESAHVDYVAIDLSKKYAKDAEILKHLFEKVKDLEQSKAIEKEGQESQKGQEGQEGWE